MELAGGDLFGRGDQPALSWWLPAGAARQVAHRIATDDGFDSGRVESDQQSHVAVPVFDRSRRRTTARVTVWTDLGESEWSEPVVLDSGLLEESDWRQGWIGVVEPERPAGGSRPAYWLRTVVELPEATEMRAFASALGLYELHLNGVRLGDEELAPGYTQYRDRVQAQAYDLTPHVVAGPNVLAVLLADGWYRGQVGLPRATDEFGIDLAVRVQVEGRVGEGWTVLTGTDETWRSATSHIVAADLIAGQREDRRLLEARLHDPAYDVSGWSPVSPRAVAASVVRPVAPPVRRVEEIAPVSVAHHPGSGAFVVDLGQDINGWTRLDDLGPAGTRTMLRHGEHLDATGALDTAHLDVHVPILPAPLPLGQVDEVVSAGVDGDAFEPRFTTHGFRYVSIEGHPGPLTVDDVTGVVVHSDLRRTGWFACSDDRLNRLHEAVVWSLRGNVCGIPTDCPQRERSGWTGDWQVFAPTAAYLFDVLGFTRSWLRDVALDQRADGCVANLSPCPPGEGFDGPLGRLNGSAGWGDVVVSAPWDLYSAYGDVSVLREGWPAMTAWLGYASRAAAGGRHPDRVRERPEAQPHETFLWDTGFHWGEWLEPGVDLGDFRAFAAADKSEVATAYLHRSATTAAQVADLIGEDPEFCRRLASGAREAWQHEFIAGDGSLRVQSQASHVRALAFDLVPDSLRPGLADRLVELIGESGNHLSTGFLSTGLLLPTLATCGRAETAYALLQQDTEPSWLTMVERGATTTWERWDGVDAAGVAHESLNHYSKGAVAQFLHAHVAGLAPRTAGYRTFAVQPVAGGGLTWARTALDCPYGRIEVAWRIAGDELEVEVCVPGGTSAEVVLPDGSRHPLGPGRHLTRGGLRATSARA